MTDRFYTYFKEWFEQSAPCGENSLVIHNKTISLRTSIGNTRSSNQDRSAFIIINNHLTHNKNLAISIIADGMGGMASGETAASSTIASFISYIAFNEHRSGLKDMCRKAVFYSNEKVNMLLSGKGGSTLSAIVYGENGCVGVNVGDSRIYYFDSENLHQLSTDDTISGQLANRKSETWEDPSRGDNRLAQFIGTSDELIPHTIDLTKYSKIVTSGFFLLTSDGSHYIGKKMIERIIKSAKDNHQIAKRIVRVSEWLSGHDNSTIVVCPNKITLNKIKTNIKTENIEQVQIYCVGKETAYLIPKETELIHKNKYPLPTNKIEKQKFKSENLFSENQSNKRKFKKEIPKDTSEKKTASNKKDKAIIDMLPPEKK